MKVKIYKPVAAALTLCLLAGQVCWAQVQPVQPVQPIQPAQPTTPPQTAEPIQPAQPAEATISSGDNVISMKSGGNWLSAQVNNLKSVINSATIEATDAVRDANISGKIANFRSRRNNNVSSSEIQDSPTSKSYSKTYPADGDDKLVIDNSYGSITINTWDKNYFKVDVVVHASAKNESDERDILDGVSISDAKDGSTVAFRTDINSGKSIWKTIFGGNGQHSLSINYTVYMPARNELVIRNRYGNIELPDLNGKVTIELNYGSIHGKSLTGESTIRERYGNIDLGNLGATWIDLSYANLSVNTVNRIQSNASYSGININKLRESGAFNIRYGGGLKIEDMDKNVDNLAVNSTYSSVNVGLSGDENANFAITVHYGDFNYHDHAVTITEKTPGDNDHGSHTTKSFKGYLGKGGSGKSIAINASYGSVQFD
jgi:hypothetical protein